MTVGTSIIAKCPLLANSTLAEYYWFYEEVQVHFHSIHNLVMAAILQITNTSPHRSTTHRGLKLPPSGQSCDQSDTGWLGI